MGRADGGRVVVFFPEGAGRVRAADLIEQVARTHRPVAGAVRPRGF